MMYWNGKVVILTILTGSIDEYYFDSHDKMHSLIDGMYECTFYFCTQGTLE